MSDDVRRQMAAAKALIQAKRYDEARAILRTVDHPTAHKWLVKLGGMAPTTAAQPAKVKAKVGMQRTWRTIWGVLTLLSLGWLCYGLAVTSQAFTEVAAETTTDAGLAGATIGAGMGASIFLCTGAPFFLLFLVLYWRNGVAIREKKQHAEMMQAMQK